MNENESKNSTGGLVMIGVVIVVVLSILFMSGCSGTIHGVSSDAEGFFGAVRRALKPSVERTEQSRLRRASDLVIAEKNRQ